MADAGHQGYAFREIAKHPFDAIEEAFSAIGASDASKMPGGEIFPDGVDYPNFMGREYNHIRLRGIALPKTSQGAETNPGGDPMGDPGKTRA